MPVARISALGELGCTVSSFVVGANMWDGQAGPTHSVLSPCPRRGPPPSLQKKGPAAWLSHSAGLAIRSPRGMGDPHDIAPRGS